jgi:hypothetical protein
MRRKNIRIKRIPTVLAEPLKRILAERVELPDIYFHRAKDDPWQIRQIKNELGEVETEEFVDLELVFSSSTSLGALAKDLLPDLAKEDFPIPKELFPDEHPYKPYGHWSVELLRKHIEYWRQPEARKYAARDVEVTRALWHAMGKPEPGDDDSELACAVGACRWRGWAINRDRLQEEMLKNRHLSTLAPTAPKEAREYLEEHMTDIQTLVLREGTGAKVLQAISRWDGEVGKRASQISGARTAGRLPAISPLHLPFHLEILRRILRQIEQSLDDPVLEGEVATVPKHALDIVLRVFPDHLGSEPTGL